MKQELIINLWAFYDASAGLVYGLAGRVYNALGTDSDKLAILKQLSVSDYITAKRYELPKRFQVSYADGTVKTGVANLNVVNDPNAQMFEDMFKNLEADLPPLPDFSIDDYRETKQKIPTDPLCVVTVLYEDEQGHMRPIVTEEDKQWVTRQEELRGREIT